MGPTNKTVCVIVVGFFIDCNIVRVGCGTESNSVLIMYAYVA